SPRCRAEACANSDRQGGGLQALHREAAGDVTQGHGGDQPAVERVVGGDVGHHDVEQVVHVAAHPPGIDDFRHAGDDIGEALEPVVGVVGGLDLDEDGDREADGGG